MSDSDDALKQRKTWASAYPNEDTYGSIIVGWVVKDPSKFDDDRRLRDVKALTLSNGWKAVLVMARSYWKKHKAGLTFDSLKRRIWNSGKSWALCKHLADLVDWAKEVTDNSEADDYDDTMRDIWMRTRKSIMGEGMMDITVSMNKRGDFDMELGKAIDLLEGVRQMGETRSAGALSMSELASRVEEEYGSPRGVPMSTGLFRIDAASLGGPRKGNLWLVTGYVSQGKTALGKEVAYSCVVNGHSVLWVSLEMSISEVRDLFVVRHSHSIRDNGVPLADVMKDTLSDEDREVYFKAARSWSEKDGIGENLNVWVPEEDVTADDIVRHAEALHRHKPIDMLVVDYSELLIPIRRRQQYRIELGDTIRRLKVAAGTFGGGDGVAVILLHQVSRKGFEKASKRGYYLLSDLAETAAAERHSNVVMWILQTEDMVADHEVVVGISKQRMGPRDLLTGTKLFENFGRAFIGNMNF